MSEIQPASITLGDLCSLALRVAGWLGVGQSPDALDLQDAWAQCQMMLQSWARQRWLIFQLVDYSKVSTGAQSYTVGVGGDFSVSFGGDFGGTNGMRPNRIEAAYLRQLTTSPGNQIDYPMTLIESYEDYSKIRLKTLQSFPQYVFYNPNWPIGQVFFWPIPQASIYELHIIMRQQLPVVFQTQAMTFSIPYEYYDAILYNLALRIRTAKRLPPPPGDALGILAKNALAILRQGNMAISRLSIPSDLTRRAQYNIFSDERY